MKKKIAVLLAAVLVLSMGTTVYAAGSTDTTTTPAPTEAEVAAQKEAATLATGVNASTSVVIDGVAQSVNPTISSVDPSIVGTAKNAASVLVSPEASVLKVVDVKLPVSFSKATITFNVSGVVAGQNIQVLHQESNGQWVIIPDVTVGDGTVTATFTSLSPVAFVSSATSDKTGEMVSAFAILSLISLAGTAVCAKKR